MSTQHQPAFPIQQQQPNLNSAPSLLPQCFVKPFHNPLQIKRNVITDDYNVTNQVLGMGINGRVLEIFHKESGEKFALKVNMLSSYLQIILSWLINVWKKKNDNYTERNETLCAQIAPILYDFVIDKL